MKLDDWQSNATRRTMLRQRGWKPSVSFTLLTRIAHWVSPDGCRTMTEKEAAEQARREKGGAR
jgi:hypothetical protein